MAGLSAGVVVGLRTSGGLIIFRSVAASLKLVDHEFRASSTKLTYYSRTDHNTPALFENLQLLAINVKAGRQILLVRRRLDTYVAIKSHGLYSSQHLLDYCCQRILRVELGKDSLLLLFRFPAQGAYMCRCMYVPGMYLSRQSEYRVQSTIRSMFFYNAHNRYTHKKHRWQRNIVASCTNENTYVFNGTAVHANSHIIIAARSTSIRPRFGSAFHACVWNSVARYVLYMMHVIFLHSVVQQLVIFVIF